MDPDSDRSELLAYLSGDEPVYRVLITWAEGIGCQVKVPPVPWTRKSRFTDAKLLAILLRTPDGGSETVMIKVCARRDGLGEARRRATIQRNRPDFAQRFLVAQSDPGVPIEPDRYLLFSTVTVELAKTVTLRDVGHAHLPALCRTLTEILMTEWNGESLGRRFRPSSDSMTVAEYLQWELCDALCDEVARRRIEAWGVNAEDADWIALAEEGRSLPNPVRMANAGALVSDKKIICLMGDAHGDAHLDNVVVQRTESGGIEAGSMRLIDPAASIEPAPLSRDIATLALSIALQLFVEQQEANPGYRLTRGEARDLIHLLLHPRDRETTDLPPYISQSIRNVYETAYAALGGRTDLWRDQYLLSLQAQALKYLSYSSIDENQCWWFFRLAARAAEAFLNNRGCLRPSELPEPVGPGPHDGAATVPALPAKDQRPPDPVPHSDDPQEDAESTPPSRGASTTADSGDSADLPDAAPKDRLEDSGKDRAEDVGDLLPETLQPELERLIAGAGRLIRQLARLEDCRTPDQVVDGARAPRHLAETLQRWLAALPAIDLDERLPIDLRDQWAKARGDASASVQSVLRGLPADRCQAVRAWKCRNGLDNEAVALRGRLADLAVLLMGGV
ncbi:hypothetical protein [Actinoallomurus soli]|uniref:hypothetical protein n=1 Tax=Actinoallomurus soli TaxID=2952535 RepID=UPI002092DFDD|nr:hypothetical protein [Actinoallomurus soli]MCO5967004.1 hypothetical protein [Actinoallomurus soli]